MEFGIAALIGIFLAFCAWALCAVGASADEQIKKMIDESQK